MNKSRVLQDGICSRAKEPGPPKIHVRKDFRMKGPAAPFLYRRIAPLAPFWQAACQESSSFKGLTRLASWGLKTLILGGFRTTPRVK